MEANIMKITITRLYLLVRNGKRICIYAGNHAWIYVLYRNNADRRTAWYKSYIVQKDEYKKDFSKKRFKAVNYSAFFAFLCGAMCSYIPGVSSINAILGSMFTYRRKVRKED